MDTHDSGGRRRVRPLGRPGRRGGFDVRFTRLVGLDKWLHAVGYAGLSFLVAAAFGRRGWRSLTAVVALVVVFGGAIELVQGALPWRSASVLDLLADAVGALVGVAAYRGWRAVRGRVRPV
ncbi:VanZ family protein [Halospeciosus flavus]|uniref:VanZ family protein n=1 Tax=Halospeciosus flavus TaxID=3032283 RepID=UPI0036167DF4